MCSTEWHAPCPRVEMQEVPAYDNVQQLLADLDQALAAGASGTASAVYGPYPQPATCWMRERITAALPLAGVPVRQMLPLQPAYTAAVTAAAVAAGGMAPGTAGTPALASVTAMTPEPQVTPGPGSAATAAGGAVRCTATAAAGPLLALELDPAVVLPLESLAQNGDLTSAQPYSFALPPVVGRAAVAGAQHGEAGGGGTQQQQLPSSAALLVGGVRVAREPLRFAGAA